MTSVRKRDKPTDRTPPGASKKTKVNQEVFLMCELVIKEGNDIYNLTKLSIAKEIAKGGSIGSVLA